MSYAICPLSVVPVRSSASHKSELISQLLFGELVEILENKGRQWSKVRCHFDNNVGWINQQQIKAITPSEFDLFNKNFAYNLDITQPIMAEDHAFPITIGAQLPNFDGLGFKIDETAYTFSGQAIFPADLKADADFLLKVARKYLYAPYLWGGRSPLGIDSSGLTQMVFKMAGYQLPREEIQQVYFGNAVDFFEESIPGDVAFFENKAGRISHCGIIMPDNQIIHSFGMVRIDKVDHYGIYNTKASRYTHKLRLIKRILPSQSVNLEDQKETSDSKSKQVELF